MAGNCQIKLIKITVIGPYLGKNSANMGHTQNQVNIRFQELFTLSKYKF